MVKKIPMDRETGLGTGQYGLLPEWSSLLMNNRNDLSPSRTLIGKTYLKRGRPAVVLARWGKGGGLRNVLIQREDGTRGTP
jgi:hypothetical protein